MRPLIPGIEHREMTTTERQFTAPRAARRGGRRRRTLAVAVVAAGMLVFCTQASPAVAATSTRSRTHAPGARPGRRAARVRMPVDAPPNVSTSHNWSGYVAYNGIFDAVSADWTVPTVTCTKANAWTLFWVGLDGWNVYGGAARTVEQGGTSAQCLKGTPTYTAFWEMWPTNAAQLSFPVHPGDQISASVTYSQWTQDFTIDVTDGTTGGSLSQVESCANGLQCDRESAEWVAEAPSHFGTNKLFALADYGTVRFTSAQATDQEGTDGPISGDQWDYSGIERIVGVNTSRAEVSVLSDAGSSFSDTWRRR